MNLIIRKKDVVIGTSRLEGLHSLQHFPVFMGSVQHNKEEDLFAEMSWSISLDSGLIQLEKLLPLDVLYQSQTTTSAVGPLWIEHHKAFAEFIEKYASIGVLEIGGAHGILAKEYQKFCRIQWTILEPNPSPVPGCDAHFIKGFFDDKFTFSEPFDTIVHSHVFEHIYEPDEFMRHLSGFIDSGKHLVFSLPNLQAWLG